MIDESGKAIYTASGHYVPRRFNEGLAQVSQRECIDMTGKVVLQLPEDKV